jgi:hypothetical protein
MAAELFEAAGRMQTPILEGDCTQHRSCLREN